MRILIILVLALTQAGCSIEEGGGLRSRSADRRVPGRSWSELSESFLALRILRSAMVPSPPGAGRSELTLTSATPMALSPIVDLYSFTVASVVLLSFMTLLRKLALSPSAKPVFGSASTVWRLEARDALPLNASLSVMGCWSTVPKAKTVLVFARKS